MLRQYKQHSGAIGIRERELGMPGISARGPEIIMGYFPYMAIPFMDRVLLGLFSSAIMGFFSFP